MLRVIFCHVNNRVVVHFRFRFNFMINYSTNLFYSTFSFNLLFHYDIYFTLVRKKKILSTAVFCSSRYYCVVPLFNPHYTMSINNHSTIQSINVRLTRYLNSLQKILSSTRQLLNFSNLISESNLASSDKILKIKQENTFRIFIYLSKILC